jgi:hypothetical protein
VTALRSLLVMLALAIPSVASAEEPAPKEKETSPIDEKADKAIADGLRWLALHQAEDGHWGLHDFPKHARTQPLPHGKVAADKSSPDTKKKDDVAGTALALLPFLAAGHTHKPPKEKADVSYETAVDAGLKWLLKQQSGKGEDKGNFGGDVESHALATLVVCEAYALTADPKLKAPSQAATDYLAKAQHTGGGWSVAPKQPGETTVTATAVHALKVAQMAGLSVPKATLRGVEKFLDSVETKEKGQYGSRDASKPTPATTAAGATCRLFLGTNPLNKSLLASLAFIKKTPPGKGGVRYELYATLLTHHTGGEWKSWFLGPDGDGKKGLRDALVARQDQKAANKGSWAGDESTGGRLGATARSLVALQIPKRTATYARRDSR